MLMTGRYSLGKERDRKLRKGTPHLGRDENSRIFLKSINYKFIRLSLLIISRLVFLSGYPIPRKNPVPGDKKSSRYPEGKKSRKNPKSRGFSENPGD